MGHSFWSEVFAVTDLEISKALALAIGWQESQVRICTGSLDGGITWGPLCVLANNRPFWYTDWNVIGPIAARYKMLVDFKIDCAWRNNENIGTRADTPQKAIALAVIGMKGKV